MALFHQATNHLFCQGFNDLTTPIPLQLKLPNRNTYISYADNWKWSLKIDPFLIQAAVSYCQTSNVSHTLIGNKTVDYSDVIGSSPVGAAPTTSSIST